MLIVQEITPGFKRIRGRRVSTLEAVVDFGTDEVPELTTRHLERRGDRWFGRNSDEAIETRRRILDKASRAAFVLTKVTEKVIRIQDALSSLKGKRDPKYREVRRIFRENLAEAKVQLASAEEEASATKALADRVDQTHPEFLQALSQEEARKAK